MPSVTLGDAHGIAVLDFGSFLDGSARDDVARAMVDSFKRVGFVYLVNHGIPKDKIRAMFDWSKRFFAQPMEVKQQAPHPPSGTHHRGYSAPGVEKVVQHIYDKDALQEVRAKALDVKESFECGWEESKSMPNIWLPDGTLSGFKEACLDFYWVGMVIKLELILPWGGSVPVQELLDEKITRIDAHSDFGSITLLLQDDVGGLEIEDPNNPGQFLVRPSLSSFPSGASPLTWTRTRLPLQSRAPS
ncbi:UPF0676 protein [Trametes pubescens]|uniref:UPF0676 protein n=1 Tax=Trametes pubescens TaxID=154538 RepID=A0A1M2W2E8_TRAPU|nr:UPF0676 protein [Trametes pubescens]